MVSSKFLIPTILLSIISFAGNANVPFCSRIRLLLLSFNVLGVINKSFDKISIARSLVNENPYFWLNLSTITGISLEATVGTKLISFASGISALTLSLIKTKTLLSSRSLLLTAKNKATSGSVVISNIRVGLPLCCWYAKFWKSLLPSSLYFSKIWFSIRNFDSSLAIVGFIVLYLVNWPLKNSMSCFLYGSKNATRLS